MSETSDTLKAGEVLQERYQIVRKLGQGAMGAVYEALHIHMRKRVALKVLHRGLAESDDVRIRFEREAIAAGSIKHPSIVAATDFGSLYDGSYYLVLEFVEGESLREVLDREGCLSQERTFKIAYQVASALCAAHEKGVVHRDVKPENIMVTPIEGEDFVKVLDFGIAKMRIDELDDPDRPLTQQGSLFGTPEYMAPEQARGLAVDERADIYALGMVAYEMLQGKSAFVSENMVDVIMAQIVDKPAPLAGHVAAEFNSLILRMLDKDPVKRPDSAEQLMRAWHYLADSQGFRLPKQRMSSGQRTSLLSDVPLPLIAPILDIGVKAVSSSSEFERPSIFASLKEVSQKKASVVGSQVPLWLPLIVLLLTGLSAGYFLRAEVQTNAVSTAAAKASAFELKREELESRASLGQRAALGALRKEIAAEEKASEGIDQKALARRYLALGHGYAEIEHYTAAIKAYRRCLELDSHYSANIKLLSHMRAALVHRDAVEQASIFADQQLGTYGADLLYDVWREHRGQVGMTAAVVRARRLVLDSQFKDTASESLKIVLSLNLAQTCLEFKGLISSALEFSDRRSLRKLNALNTRTGCGKDAQQDCFKCLRTREVPLYQALKAAQERPKPAYLSGTTLFSVE